MRSARRHFLVLLFTLSFCAVAMAGEDKRVSLDVIAAPPDGAPIAGLAAQDFTLLDNGKPQPLASFMPNQNDLAQTKVVILLDAVNAAYVRLTYARQGIEGFLHSSNGHLAYPTALALATDDSTKLQGNYSTDGNKLEQQLKQIDIGLRTVSRSQGVYGAEDRIGISISALERVLVGMSQTSGRKLLIWVSPGWAYFSGAILESKSQNSLFNEVMKLSTLLRETRTTLYAVDPSGSGEESVLKGSFYKEFLKPVKRARDISVGNISLEVLAVHSGGQALCASNNIAGLIGKAVADAEPFYTLTYVPADDGEPDAYHSIEVRVNKPGVTVRTASGYYAGR